MILLSKTNVTSIASTMTNIAGLNRRFSQLTILTIKSKTKSSGVASPPVLSTATRQVVALML